MNMPTCVIDFVRTCKIRCICGKWLNRTSHERVSRCVAWPKNCAGLLQPAACLAGGLCWWLKTSFPNCQKYPPVAFPVLGATLNCGSAGLKIWPIPWWFSEIIAALATSSRWWRCSKRGESRPSVHWQQIDRIVRAVLTALENAWSAVLLITAKMQK